ncbi:hypothetical protein LCL96_15540 [Rossellomorea aquimaris]|uniref:hypothetical protein n=1 Tax=Rossellomorea aquimaris TaxID=189382 RepID=UPI001CD8097D|nr:hypothetical protein [Rossellomorea aquimaris]MCA1060351.1 hypothetical protein [Rossellomorea aquimaris]
MRKNRFCLVLFTSLFLLVMAGCQQNKNIDLNEEVKELKIVTWEKEEYVVTMNDKKFINELIDDLDDADTLSTNTLDFEMPPYKILFINNDGETIHQLGYYKSPVLLGITGQYWEFNMIYGLTKDIPF